MTTIARDPALLSSLRERVADAAGPDRALFAEVWFACTGKQSPDTKARFAILLDAKAWTDAALWLAFAALPEQRIAVTAGAGELSIAIGAPHKRAAAAPHAVQDIEGPGSLGLMILAAVLDELIVKPPARVSARPSR